MAATLTSKMAILAATAGILLSAAACNHRNASSRAAATSKIGTDEAWVMQVKEIEANLKNLRSNDVHERRQAAYELATSNSPKVTEKLLLALDDKDDEVKSLAVLGFGLLREKRATSRLLPLLADSNSPELRREAAWALGRIGDVAARPALSRLLAEQDTDRKRSAALALARLGDGESLRILMGRDGGTLGGWNSALSGLALALDRLHELPSLDSSHGFPTEEWGQVLSELPECRGVQALLEQAADMEPVIMADHVVQDALQDALGKLPEGCAKFLLEQATRHPSPKARLFALRALENYATPAVREVALQACRDKNDEVAAEAASLLAKLGARLPAKDVRRATLEAIDPRDPDASSKIVSLFDLKEWDVINRIAISVDAYRWLGRLELAERAPSRSLPAALVEQWLSHVVQSSYSKAATVVDSAPEAILPALELAARAKSDQGPAAHTLDRILARAVELGQTELIVKLFRQSDAKIRCLIVGARLPIGSPEVRSLLRGAAHDPDPAVRRATVMALRKQNRQALLDDAVALLQDPDRGVQSEALLAIAALGNEGQKTLVLDPTLAHVPELRAAWLEAALVYDAARAEQQLVADFQSDDPVLSKQYAHFPDRDKPAPRAWRALGRMALNHLGRSDPNRLQFALLTAWTTSDALAEFVEQHDREASQKGFIEALSDPDLRIRLSVARVLLRAMQRRNPHPILVQWFNTHLNSLVELYAIEPDIARKVGAIAGNPDALFALARLETEPTWRWHFVARAFEAGTTQEQRNRWLPQLAPPAGEDNPDVAEAIARTFDTTAFRRNPDWLVDLASPQPKFSTITAPWMGKAFPLSVEETPRDKAVVSTALALLEKPQTRAFAGYVLGNIAEPSTLPRLQRALAGPDDDGTVALVRAAYLAALASNSGSASAILFDNMARHAKADAASLAWRLGKDTGVPAKVIVELAYHSKGPSAYSLEHLLASRSDPHLDQLLIRLVDEPKLFAEVFEKRLRRGLPVPLSLARQAIRHPEPGTQRAAAMALGAAHQVGWLPRILRATCDDSPVAHFATQTFSSEELSIGLTAESARVRACTLDLLSQRASFDLQPALVTALQDLSPVVQERAIALATLHPTAQVVSTVERVLRERILPIDSFGHYLVFYAHSKGPSQRARLEALTAEHEVLWYAAYRDFLDHPPANWEPYNDELWCSPTFRDPWVVADIFTNGTAEAKNSLLDCMARENGAALMSQLGANPVFLPPEVMTLLAKTIPAQPRNANTRGLLTLLDRLDTPEVHALVNRVASTELDSSARDIAQLTQQRWRLTVGDSVNLRNPRP